jgi:hypothetical protein
VLPAAPLWLYTFWVVTSAGNVYWRYTSFGANVTSNGNVFTSAELESHGELKRSVQPDQDAVQIEGFYTAGNIFAYALGLPALNVWCQIEEDNPASAGHDDDFVHWPFEQAGVAGRRQSAEGEFDFCQRDRRVRERRAELDPGGALSVPALRARLRRSGNELSRQRGDQRRSQRIADDHVTGAGLSGNNMNGFDKTTANYWAWGWIVLGTGVNSQIVTC